VNIRIKELSQLWKQFGDIGSVEPDLGSCFLDLSTIDNGEYKPLFARIERFKSGKQLK
jgi:hypothetical protein